MKKHVFIYFLISVVAVMLAAYFAFFRGNSTEIEMEELALDSIPEPKIMFGLPIDSFELISSKVEKNQTFSDILSQSNISQGVINQLVDSAQAVFNLRAIREGQPYHLFFKTDSIRKLHYFVYQMDKINYVRFSLQPIIKVEKGRRKVKTDTVSAEGVITSSLWNTMKNSGINPMVALQMSDIYAWTIDFYGLQKNDRFKVIFTTQSIDSVVVGIERILSCQFNHSGKDFYAFYFVQDSLKGDYFDEKGESLRRAYLKAPLKFSRISSGFSNARLHPVLKIRRPHHGVDYAAPKGTPVMTIGDGKVVSMSWDGGYGRRVVIRHNSNHKTGYAHLSGYAKGLKQGGFVKQGDIIGYVGSSGLSTGPHLDFRFYENDKPVNPLTVESPPAIPIHENQKAIFQQFVDSWMKKLN